MNYSTWSKKKFWLVIIGVFFLGIIMSSGKTNTITKEVVKEVPVEKIVTNEVVREVPVEKVITKEVQVDKNREIWEKLIGIDDQLLGQSATGFNIYANLITDLSNLDYSNVENYTSQIKNITNNVNSLSTQRHQLLKELGLE